MNTQAERFWAKVATSDTCWIWTAARSSTGYGNFYVGKVDGRKTYRGAHKVAWEQVHGPVPEGMVLDHICRNRACVRPDHLRVATQAENILIGTGWSARNAAVDACPKGHIYDETNTMTRDKRRRCRTCANERRKRYPSYRGKRS